MLQTREIDVVGKRKAVIISNNPNDRDEVALLEIIWNALGEYETKRRRIKGLRVRWTLSRVNSNLSDIVLVYPCFFINHDAEIGEELVPRHQRQKKTKTHRTPQK